MRHSRRPLLGLLAAVLALPGAALGQATTPTTAPTVSETQSFSLVVPPVPHHAAPPATVALPNRSRVTPAAAPLPRRLAYTGTDPRPLIAAGLAVVLLSLLARRWSRARLRARAEA